MQRTIHPVIGRLHEILAQPAIFSREVAEIKEILQMLPRLEERSKEEAEFLRAYPNVKVAAAEVSIDISNNADQTLLFRAVSVRNRKVVQLLMEAKADPNILSTVMIRNAHGGSKVIYQLPIHVAVSYGWKLEIVKSLISGNSNLERPNPEDGFTPLGVAVREKNIGVTSALLEAKADVHKVTCNDCSALDIILANFYRNNVDKIDEIEKNLSLICLLLRYGAVFRQDPIKYNVDVLVDLENNSPEFLYILKNISEQFKSLPVKTPAQVEFLQRVEDKLQKLITSDRYKPLVDDCVRETVRAMTGTDFSERAPAVLLPIVAGYDGGYEHFQPGFFQPERIKKLLPEEKAPVPRLP